MLLDTDLGSVGANVVATILSLVLLKLLSVVFNNYELRKKYKSPPLAPAGMWETMQSLGGSNAPWFVLDMAKKAGSYIYKVRIPLPGGVYVVGNPLLMREILLDKTTDKPKEIYSDFDVISGATSIFSRKSDKRWFMARKGVMHAFSSSEVNRMNRICSKHVEFWIENKLKPCIESGEPIDISVEMCRITFGVILESAFEYENVTDEEYQHYEHHLGAALKEFAFKQSINPLRKIYGPLLQDYRDAKKSCGEVQKFSKKLLDAYRAKKDKSSNKTVIRLVVENPCYANERERISDISVLLVAGHDTTGYSLSSTLILLAKHPAVNAKLRKELLTMEESQRPRCQYMRDVVKESNRILPVTAMAPVRRTGRDFVTKDGMIIPKGALLFLPSMLGNRYEHIFEEPDTFNPDRWENADKTMLDSHFGFSLGNRICVGKSLAYSELWTSLPELVCDYDFEIVKEGYLDNFMTLKYEGTLLKASNAKKAE